MSLPKRNSRPIVVNDVRFRWAFSAPYDAGTKDHKLNLTIQAEHGTASKLIGTGRCPTGDEYLLEPTEIVTPKIVAKIILAALEAGWIPDGDEDWYFDNIESYFTM